MINRVRLIEGMNTKTLQLATGVFEVITSRQPSFVFNNIWNRKGRWREEREGIMSKKCNNEQFLDKLKQKNTHFEDFEILDKVLFDNKDKIKGVV